MEKISNDVTKILNRNIQPMAPYFDLLKKISDNILKDPQNEKFRKLNLNSSMMSTKLIPTIGALETLFLMGFEEGDDQLLLPMDNSLTALKKYRTEVVALKSLISRVSNSSRSSPRKQANSQPELTYSPAVQESESELFATLKTEFERVMIYENTSHQEKARKVIPVNELSQRARKSLQAANKSDDKDSKPLDFQDYLLLELLSWFKNDFFRWFDVPHCSHCQMKMVSAGSLTPTQEDLEWGANRVEGSRCQKCGASHRFPRINHPGKLLETREGRCGEWANCFTLCCRALGMDARYVHDYTDHVWTEVFSQSQGRWLHADSCENKLDLPLMYERGWNKKLSYIFAFSKDEAVDVTWRYTNKHSEVLGRRRKCRESWLVSVLMDLSKDRQENFPQQKQRFLELRRVAEIAESFQSSRDCKEGEAEGRNSGSLAWRLSRGEMLEQKAANYTFNITQEDLAKREFLVKYSPSSDSYLFVSRNGEELKGWHSGTNSHKDIFRKQESDWHMVYLARKDSSSSGSIKWVFEWNSNTDVQISSVLVVFQHTTYQSGKVKWEICDGNKCFQGSQGFRWCVGIKKDDISSNTHKLELSAELCDGDGNEAWQHAQLFRQTDSDHDKYPFMVHIKFA
ncbi:unnamed protein product, partial [Meganyctiphanes norvegica]